MEQLLLNYLTTGDFPLEFKSKDRLPINLKNILDLCSQKLNESGIMSKEEAQDFLFNI
jgi:hypothetical protein